LFRQRKRGVSFLGVFPEEIDGKLRSAGHPHPSEPGCENRRKNPKELKMKRSYLLALASLSLLVAVGAQAQVAGRSRADVEQEAVRAASAPDQNVVRGSRGADPFKVVADPAAVSAQAVAVAHAPDQNVVRGSRGADPFKSMADPAAVYAQAVTAASAPDQNVVGGSRVNSRVISTMANPAEASVQAQRGATTAK
jgi:hypothetical protein